MGMLIRRLINTPNRDTKYTNSVLRIQGTCEMGQYLRYLATIANFIRI